MRREGALLGGEASGHFFLPGGFPGDALYACLKFMEILKESGTPLSVMADSFPTRVSSHDLKLPLNADGLPELSALLEARARALGAKVSTVDGVRAVFQGGWGIVRASVTEPVLSCRFEAGDLKALHQLVEDWFDGLPDLKKRLLAKMEKNLLKETP
jgi:phosphomannomutase/phosphoglucomutase